LQFAICNSRRLPYQTMASFWQWWAHSDWGLATRIGLGAAFFITLTLWELAKKGRQARRWREYLFLLTAVGAAMLYGVINDQITVTISWEYFYYGKGLSAVLGPDTPPAAIPLRWEAAKVGMKATWTAGLIIGASILMANSIRKKLPRLDERELYRLLLLVLMPTVAAAVAGWVAGRLGLLVRLGGFREMVAMHMFRPVQFMSVWGIHLGGYIGGAVGALLAAWLTMWERRRRAAAGSRAPGMVL
jgi:hypothetical protein